MFSSAVPYKNQHYADLKRDCVNDKKLFEDPEFPTTNTSLYFRKPLPGTVQWKRPGVSETSCLWMLMISVFELQLEMIAGDLLG